MSADVGRIAVRLHASRSRRTRAAALARELREALPGALSDALRRTAGPGIAVVPSMRISLSAPLARVRGRDLARVIAEACFDAASDRCEPIVASAAHDALATRVVERLRFADGVRLARAEDEAAAWLVALARDDPAPIWRCSPYADLRSLTLARAFAALSERVASADTLLDALGTRWSRMLAERCAEPEARRIVRRLAANASVDAGVWVAVAERFAKLNAAERCAPWRAALVHVTEEPDPARRAVLVPAVRTIAQALERAPDGAPRGAGASSGRANASDAARHAGVRDDAGAVASSALAASGIASDATANDAARDSALARPNDSRASDARENDADGENRRAARGAITDARLAPAASALTGLWCLLPHLARLTAAYVAGERRAAAVAVAERLAGPDAVDDPAVAAWCGDRPRDDVLAALPPAIRVDRLAVSSVRAFARTLRGFERASCTYVLRAMLDGPGVVAQRDGGWIATLPRSPLRVVLDYAGVGGKLGKPWGDETYAYVADDDVGA